MERNSEAFDERLLHKNAREDLLEKEINYTGEVFRNNSIVLQYAIDQMGDCSNLRSGIFHGGDGVVTLLRMSVSS